MEVIGIIVSVLFGLGLIVLGLYLVNKYIGTSVLFLEPEFVFTLFMICAGIYIEYFIFTEYVHIGLSLSIGK